MCLTPTDQVVTVNRFEVDTSQCKHPTIVDNLISSYQFKQSYLSENCDICNIYFLFIFLIFSLDFEEYLRNEGVFDVCDVGDVRCAVLYFLTTVESRQAYANYNGLSEYDIESLVSLLEDKFTDRFIKCAGASGDGFTKETCEEYKGCNKANVVPEICDTSYGAIANYCASPRMDGGVKLEMKNAKAPVCRGDSWDCVDKGGILVYDSEKWENKCIMPETADISGLSTIEV